MVWTIPLNSSGTGLDWDWIREHYLQRASPEEVEAQIKSLSRSWGSVIQKPTKTAAQKAKENHPHKVADETVELICDYYSAGNRVPWIAKETGVTEATVRRYLREAGTYEPTRDRKR